MTEEKKLILNMLKEGKISDEEAIRLLEAIGEAEPGAGKEKDRKYEKFERNVVEKITDSIDKIIKKTSHVISNIDFEEIGNYFNINSRFKGKLETSYTKALDGQDAYDIAIKNPNGKVQFQTWEKEYIQVDAKIYYDESLVTEDYPFLSIDQEENFIDIQPGKNGTVNNHAFDIFMMVYLPKVSYNHIEVETSNGDILGYYTQCESLKVDTSNGKIYINGMESKRIELRGNNASIEAIETQGDQLWINSTNGKISAHGVYLKELDVETINGAIEVSNLTDLTSVVRAKTTNGHIGVELSHFSRPIKVYLHGLNRYSSRISLSENFGSIIREHGNVVAYTDAFDEGEDHLYIDGSTVNGSVEIG